MHRIDTSTATLDHKFTEGDPTIPVAATTVSALWLNAVQEELVCYRSTTFLIYLECQVSFPG